MYIFSPIRDTRCLIMKTVSQLGHVTYKKLSASDRWLVIVRRRRLVHTLVHTWETSCCMSNCTYVLVLFKKEQETYSLWQTQILHTGPPEKRDTSVADMTYALTLVSNASYAIHCVIYWPLRHFYPKQKNTTKCDSEYRKGYDLKFQGWGHWVRSIYEVSLYS